MTTRTAEQNLVRLREAKDRALDALEAVEATLRDLDVVVIADVVTRCGFHPYREGSGRALTELLLRRHRDQTHPPLVPTVTTRDVTALADELGITRQFEPTRRIDVD